MIRMLSLSLALLIAVTSQQMMMARGATYDAAGQVILCTGQGPKVVTLDAQGNPIGPVHFCPDCALTFIAFAGAHPLVAAWVGHTQTVVRNSIPVVIPKTVLARGPPVFV